MAQIIENLYWKIRNLIPVSRVSSEDYKDILHRVFLEYMNYLRDLHFGEKEEAWNRLVERASKTCEKLEEIVRLQYLGLHQEAFMEFNRLVYGDNSDDGLFSLMYKKEIPVGTSFYRMREFAKKKGVHFNEMFHIPLSQRGLVKTQRYSTPGYPCLYMGETIYGCWEELNRPLINRAMVARLVNTRDLQFIDMTVPTLEACKNNVYKRLRSFPLILACSVPERSENDVFKPEYIISQLLTETLIKNNRDHQEKLIHGIFYTSVFENKDKMFPSEALNNYAMPVFDPLCGKEHCKTLSSLFKITEPTCDEYEQLRHGYYADRTFVIYQRQEQNQYQFGYADSAFYVLQHRLQDEEAFPLHVIE